MKRILALTLLSSIAFTSFTFAADEPAMKSTYTAWTVFNNFSQQPITVNIPKDIYKQKTDLLLDAEGNPLNVKQISIPYGKSETLYINQKYITDSTTNDVLFHSGVKNQNWAIIFLQQAGENTLSVLLGTKLALSRSPKTQTIYLCSAEYYNDVKKGNGTCNPIPLPINNH